MSDFDETKSNRAGIDALGLLSQISRELRMSVNTIAGNTEFLSHANVDSAVMDRLATVKQASDRLIGLTNNITELLSINSGEFRPDEKEYCITDLIVELRTRLEQSAMAKKLDASFDYDKALPYRLVGDYERITFMLRNLIANAVAATNEGCVSVSIKALPSKQGASFIRFDISDSGDGILREDVVKILNGKEDKSLFADKAYDEALMAIYLIKVYSAAMGGKFTAKAVRDTGTVVTLLISQKTIGLTTLGDYSEVAQITATSTGIAAEKRRAIIVNDDAETVRREHVMLHRSSVEVDVADSAEMALELIRNTKYDLIVLDYGEDTMGELEMASRIRGFSVEYPQEREKWDDAVIIAVAGSYISQDKLMMFGINDYLLRPVEDAAVEKILRTWFPGNYGEEAEISLPEDADIRKLEKIGLSIGKALGNFNGDVSEYKKVLTALVRSGDAKCQMLGRYVELHDYKNYIVAMRGLVGVSQVIGAKWLEQMAKKLELAAESGLRDVIEKDTKELTNKFKKLLSDISSAIITRSEDAIKGAITKDDLTTRINELKNYLADYQISEAEELFFELAQYSYPSDRVMELFHEAEEYMMSYRYNETLDTLDGILTALQDGA